MGINFGCPLGGSNVVVTNNAICACGTIDSGGTVKVQVLKGWVSDPGSMPGGLGAGVSGLKWAASNVAVPPLDPDNKMTVVAWLILMGSGSGATVISRVSQCFAGGSGAVDCCAQCASGGIQTPGLIAEVLVEEVELIVDVPSGANAGTYRAVAVASLAWELTIGDATHTVTVADGALLLRGPSGTAAGETELEPFSATFAGAFFGSDDDVVLTIP